MLIYDKILSYHLLVSSLELGRGILFPRRFFADGKKQIFAVEGFHIVHGMGFSPADRFRPMRIRHASSRIIALPSSAMRSLGTNPSVRAFLLSVTLVMIW